MNPPTPSPTYNPTYANGTAPINNPDGSTTQPSTLTAGIPNTVGAVGSGIPTTINSDVLGAGQTSLTVPTTTPTPPVTPIVTAPTGTTVGDNGSATVNPPETSSVGDGIKEKFSALGKLLSTKSDVTTQLQNEQQLATKTASATQSYNAYNQAKLDAQQEIERMYNQPGVTREAVAGAVAEYTRTSNANLANLAIKAQSDQGLLDAARQTIKDKLDAQFGPVQDQIDFLTKFAAVNNNDLTDSEKYKFDQQAAQKKTDLANITKTADDLHQNLLQNGAPQTVYSALDKISNDYVKGTITAEQAQSQMYQAAGNFGKDAYKAAQTNSINAKTYGDTPLSVNEAKSLGVPYGTTRQQAIDKGITPGSSSSATFTQSQLNTGAAHAGVDISVFKGLDTDAKNYFVHLSTATAKSVNDAINHVADGSENPDDVKAEIDQSLAPDEAKTYLKKRVDEVTPETTSGGGFWNSLVSLFNGK